MAAIRSIPANPFRCHVKGLSQTPVSREGGRIVEEEHLCTFFFNHGCNIKDVRLMIDLSTGRCRGFGFVDLADEESFHKALTLDGNRHPDPIVLDARATNGLVVQVAKDARPSHPDDATLRNELTAMREQTQTMERSLRWRRARVQDVEKEVEAELLRQHKLERCRQIEAQMAAERKKQEEIHIQEEACLAEERHMQKILREEQERTRALEMITQQNKLHDDSDLSPKGDEDLDEFKDPVLVVRNTFLQYEPRHELARTRTAPPTSGAREHKDPGSVEEFQVVPHLRDIGRHILETKMQAEPMALVQTQSKNSDANVAPEFFAQPKKASPTGMAITPRSWADERDEGAQDFAEPETTAGGSEADGAGSEAEGQRVVRIRNLPIIRGGAEEVKKLLTAELARLWLVRKWAEPPRVEAIVMTREVVNGTSPGCTEALVTFVCPSDAAWLVDQRHPCTWSSAETMSIHGHVLQAEWPTPAPVARADWQKLRYKADTDVSSQISYATDGTKRSFPLVDRRTSRSSKTSAAAASSSSKPVQLHPTVVLHGIDTSEPIQNVYTKVSSLIKRHWSDNGYAWPLHSHDGLVVREPKRIGDQNGGGCVLRFQRYVDAKWLVEKQKGLALTLDGRLLQVEWAKPKDN